MWLNIGEKEIGFFFRMNGELCCECQIAFAVTEYCSEGVMQNFWRSQREEMKKYVAKMAARRHN